MENIFFLNDKNFNLKINVNNNTNKDLYIIDTMTENVDAKIEIFIESNSNFEIIISSLNTSNFTKHHNIIIHHLGDNSKSSCYVYGIGKEQSKISFNLEAIIKDTSIGNYCEQSIKGILLSNDAKIEGKPNLIINTNNIKAKHALAIGSLNKNHIFYLQNKGISKNDAIKLIIMSYFNVILSKIKDDEKRENITEKIYKNIGEI